MNSLNEYLFFFCEISRKLSNSIFSTWFVFARNGHIIAGIPGLQFSLLGKQIYWIAISSEKKYKFMSFFLNYMRIIV